MKNIGLRFAAVLFIVLSSLTAAQAQAPRRVYRYDARGPEEIFANGFVRDPFKSRNLALQVQHDATYTSSAFISTTSRLDYAIRYANGWIANFNPQQATYWIYEIVPGPNFVDVAASYRETVAAMEPGYARTQLDEEENTYTREFEYAAIALIETQRIVRATQYNVNGGAPIVEENLLYQPNLTPEIRPGYYPLGYFSRRLHRICPWCGGGWCAGGWHVGRLCLP